MLLSYTSMLCKGIKVFDNNYHFILGKNAYFEFMTIYGHYKLKINLSLSFVVAFTSC